ncbi:MAG: hypothetical protein ABEL76_14555 [Bradymonadaceae bacterium]
MQTLFSNRQCIARSEESSGGRVSCAGTFCALVLAASACWSGQSPEPFPLRADVGDESDSAVEGPPSDSGGDGVQKDANSEDSNWKRSVDCGGRVAGRESDERFEKPERPPIYEDGPDTADGHQEFENRVGATFDAQPANNLEPRGNQTLRHDLYARYGEEVTLHFTLGLSNVGTRELDVQLIMTRDYRPVDAEHILFDAQRNDVVERHRGSVARFDMRGRVVPLSVTIPASEFPERGLYRIGWILTVSGPADEPPFKGVITRDTNHYSLFYGSFDRPGHPCFPEAKRMEPTELESKLGSNDIEPTPYQGGGIAVIPGVVDTISDFPSNGCDNSCGNQRRRTWNVEPGQRLSVNISLRRHRVLKKRNFPAVLVPVFDGRVVDRRFHVRRAYLDVGNPPLADMQISARRRMTIQVPDEPGTYEFMVVGWNYPYAVWADRQGRNQIWRSGPGNNTLISNVLRFRVPERE